jgi:hypothetical protein
MREILVRQQQYPYPRLAELLSAALIAWSGETPGLPRGRKELRTVVRTIGEKKNAGMDQPAFLIVRNIKPEIITTCGVLRRSNISVC